MARLESLRCGRSTLKAAAITVALATGLAPAAEAAPSAEAQIAAKLSD